MCRAIQMFSLLSSHCAAANASFHNLHLFYFYRVYHGVYEEATQTLEAKRTSQRNGANVIIRAYHICHVSKSEKHLCLPSREIHPLTSVLSLFKFSFSWFEKAGKEFGS